MSLAVRAVGEAAAVAAANTVAAAASAAHCTARRLLCVASNCSSRAAWQGVTCVRRPCACSCAVTPAQHIALAQQRRCVSWRARQGASATTHTTTTASLPRRHAQHRRTAATISMSSSSSNGGSSATTTATAYTRADTAASLFRRAFAPSCGTYSCASSPRAASRLRDDDVCQLRAASFFPRLWSHDDGRTTRTTATAAAAAAAALAEAGTAAMHSRNSGDSGPVAASNGSGSDNNGSATHSSRDAAANMYATAHQAHAALHTTTANTTPPTVQQQQQQHYEHAYAIWQHENTQLRQAQHELARLYEHAAQRSYVARWRAVQQHYSRWYAITDLVVCAILLLALHAILEFRTYAHFLTDVKVIDYKAYLESVQEQTSGNASKSGKRRRRIDVK